MESYYGTGKRKCSIARVFLRPGKGSILVNRRSLDHYFTRDIYKKAIQQPLLITNLSETLDIYAFVKGGGTSGQADAIKHGISRALLEYNKELRSTLKREGLLKRDSRIVERQKYGKKGARASYQFSKR